MSTILAQDSPSVVTDQELEHKINRLTELEDKVDLNNTSIGIYVQDNKRMQIEIDQLRAQGIVAKKRNSQSPESC